MSLKTLLKRFLATKGYTVGRVHPDFPILRPIEPNGVDILGDPAFQASCKMLGSTSLLDTPRLANLWMLCRLTDPMGAIAEIGTFRGGGALHLSNCCPRRQIVICDPFSKESFEALDPNLDQIFHHGQFADHSEAAVRKLFADRDALIIPGYFPKSAQNMLLPKLSFVHLDVDAYEATKQSLHFLLTGQALLPKSLIVLDDFNRRADGVDRAVAEVAREHSGMVVLPVFPGQAVVVPESWRN